MPQPIYQGAEPTALNYVDYVMLNQSADGRPTRAQEVAWSMIKAGSVMSRIVMRTDNRMKMSDVRYTGFDLTEAWRKVNDNLVTTRTLPKAYTEDKYVWGWDGRIEKIYLDAKESPGEREMFRRLYEPEVKKLTYVLNHRLFENRHTGTKGLPDNSSDVNPDCFVGIRPRLAQAGDANSVYQIPAECRINANIDLSPGADLKTNVNTLLSILDNAMEVTGTSDGDDVTGFMGQTLLSRIPQGVRLLGAGGGWSTDKDAIGRMVETYRKAQIMSPGRLAPDQTTGNSEQILTGQEGPTGLLRKENGGQYASIFLVKSTGPRDFCMEQFYDDPVRDIQTTDNGITKQITIYNAYGLVQADTRSLVQIYGIKVA